jgi:hypothetical protein
MSKKCRSEGNRVACAIKSNKSKWYIADVDLEDDGDDVFACSETVKKTLGKVVSGFMLISAGIKNLIVVVDVNSTLSEELDAREWLIQSLKEIAVTHDFESKISGEGHCFKFVCELDTPFKLKDVVRSSAFSYLRSKGLMQEESEDEEFYDF